MEATRRPWEAAIVRPHLLQAIVGWLRAGYPHGVPTQDYVPLIALLRRRLTDDEVAAIARRLASDRFGSDVSRVDVGVRITEVTDEMPSEDDIARVRAVLERAGWRDDDAETDR